MGRFFALLIIISYLLIPQVIIAQNTVADISIDMIPLNPEPGATVILRATSYGVDLSQSTLEWKYNGRVVATGIGKTSITIIAPASGSTGAISATVTGVGFDSAVASVTLRPASVDVLWEAADAYTPPFYKGKALLPVGGVMRVTAIPSASAPKSLSYTWTRNSSAMQDASGYGKSSVLLRHNALNPQETIAVSLQSGSFGGTGSAQIVPSTPRVVAYENNEGFIGYARGYQDRIPLRSSGVVLHFEPYYFSAPGGIATDLVMESTLDGERINPSQQNEIGFTRPAGTGQSTLELSATTAVYSLQNLRKTFALVFN